MSASETGVAYAPFFDALPWPQVASRFAENCERLAGSARYDIRRSFPLINLSPDSVILLARRSFNSTETAQCNRMHEEHIHSACRIQVSHYRIIKKLCKIVLKSAN